MNVNITYACRLCLGNSELNLLSNSHLIKKYVTLSSNENDICPMWICKQCDDTVKNWEDYLSNVGKVQIIFTEQLKNSQRIQKFNSGCDAKVAPISHTETDLNFQTPSKKKVNCSDLVYNENRGNSKFRTPSKYRSYSKNQSEDIRLYLSPEKLKTENYQSTNSVTITPVNDSDERELLAGNVAIKANGEIKQKDTPSSTINNKNNLSKIAGGKEVASCLQVPITSTKSMKLVNDSEVDDVEIVEVNNETIQIDPILDDKSDVMEIIDITNEDIVVSPCNTSRSPSDNLVATSKDFGPATNRKRIARSSYRLKWDPTGVECLLCNVVLTERSQFNSHVRSMMHKVKLKIHEPIKCVECNRPVKSIGHLCKPVTKKVASKSIANNDNTNNNTGNPSPSNGKIGAVDDVEISLVPDVINKRTPSKISCKNNDDNNSNDVTINADNADDSKIDGSAVGKVESSLGFNAVTMTKLPAIKINSRDIYQNNISNSNNTDKNKISNNNDNNNNNNNNNNNVNNINNNNNNNNAGSTSSDKISVFDKTGTVNLVVEKESLVTYTCLSCNTLLPLRSSFSHEHNCRPGTTLPAAKNSDRNCNKENDNDTNNSLSVYSKKTDSAAKGKEDINKNKTTKQNHKRKSIQCKVCKRYYSEDRLNDHMTRFHPNLTNANHGASPFDNNHGYFGSSPNSKHLSGKISPHQLVPKNIYPNDGSVNVIKGSSKGEQLVHNNRPSANNRNTSNDVHVGKIDSEQWENGPPFQCRSCNVLFRSRHDFYCHGCGNVIKTFKTTANGHNENTKRTTTINWKKNRKNKNTQSSLKQKYRKHNVFGNKNRPAKAKLKGHNAMQFSSASRSFASSQSSSYASNTESEFGSQSSFGTVSQNATARNNQRPLRRTMKKTSARSRSVIKFCINCDQRLLSNENVHLHQEHCEQFEIVGRSDKLFARKCPNCSFISSSFKGVLKHYKNCSSPTQQRVNNKGTKKNDDCVLNLVGKHTMKNECVVNLKRPSDVINSSKRDQVVRNKSSPQTSSQSMSFRPNGTQPIAVSNVHSLWDANATSNDGTLSPFNFVTHKN